MKKLDQKREEFIESLNLDPNDRVDQLKKATVIMAWNECERTMRELSGELFEKV